MGLARHLAGVLAAPILLLGIACGSAEPGESVVIGQVTRVVASSVTVLAELEIVDEQGRTWKFEANGFVGFTPSHLEEHAATGEPVRIEYFEEDGRLIVTLATDG